ncbi:MAG: hypothetical protein ACI4F0_03110, partial [Agathobacter sp.]
SGSLICLAIFYDYPQFFAMHIFTACSLSRQKTNSAFSVAWFSARVHYKAWQSPSQVYPTAQ